jgi:hypothetical protein
MKKVRELAEKDRAKKLTEHWKNFILLVKDPVCFVIGIVTVCTPHNGICI